MTLSIGGFRRVVASSPAPIATGWSDPCREGLAPSQEPCLSTAHGYAFGSNPPYALDDPKHAIPPYDAILLLAPKRAGDERLQAALKPLLGKIDIATMREANLRASGNDSSSSPDAVARWLWERVGKR